MGARKRYKKACKDSELLFRNKLTKKLLSIEKDNPKGFWDLIKKMKKWGLANEDPSDSIHPNEWVAHFHSLRNEGRDTQHTLMAELDNFEKQKSFCELDFRITSSDVETALKRLKKGAAPGVDGISAELLLAAKTYLMPLLVLMFNKVFTYAEYPVLWTQNFLKPIFKKGNICDPNNYRGIAIGSAMSKLFNLILLERLDKRIDITHPISENQIGFRKGHRTADHIICFKYNYKQNS